MHKNLLCDALNKYMRFTDEEITTLLKVMKIRTFKKKETILALQQKEQYISCVAKGLVRKYIMCGSKSMSTDFAAEGGIVCSNSSIGTQLPSEYGVQALENTTLLSFTLDALNWLYTQSPVYFEFGKIIVSTSLLRCEEREILLMKYDALHRLQHFIDKKGELFLRLPQHYIASYLNIQPQTFSKLKKELSGGKERLQPVNAASVRNDK